jgi:cell division protein FtsB
LKHRRKIIAVAGVLFTGAAIALLSGDQGLFTFYSTWRQIRDLRRELDQSHRTVDSLRVENHRLKHDTAYIERIAREKYGMAKENEKMYKFIEEK